MYVDIYDNRTGEKIGTVTEQDGQLVTDSVNMLVLNTIADFESRPDFTPSQFFKEISQRWNTIITYFVFNDENQRVVIQDDDTIIILKKDSEK